MGARFSTPERGAWYAAFELATAKAEVIFHKSIEFAEIDWKEREEIQYDDYLADFTATFHDLRGIADEALSPTSYVRSQQLAVELMELGSLGIVYPSVRREGGTCIACFRPCGCECAQEHTVRLIWTPLQARMVRQRDPSVSLGGRLRWSVTGTSNARRHVPRLGGKDSLKDRSPSSVVRTVLGRLLLAGPPNVVTPYVVEGGGLPGLSPVHADPMQCGRTFQKHCSIDFLISVRPRSLAASRGGSQSRYPQQLNCFPIPLLFDLVPMLSLIVGAKEGSIAVQRQLGPFHHQLAHGRKSAGQRRIRCRDGRNLRLGREKPEAMTPSVSRATCRERGLRKALSRGVIR